MKKNEGFAMGHTFSTHEIFYNFDVKKLKLDYTTLKKLTSDYNKREFAEQIFAKGMQLIIEDIIENNIHFQLPKKATSESYLFMNKTQNEEFKKAFKKGKWRDVDFITSNFTGYQLALSIKSKRRAEKIKPVYLGYKHKDRITELTNEGKRY